MALDKELQDLFSSYRNTNTYDVDIFVDGKLQKVKCKKISLKQFQRLVQATTDNPITQHNFYSAINSFIKDNMLDVVPDTLTVVDRLLYIIKARSQDISSTLELKEQQINLDDVYQTILDKIQEKPNLFQSTTITKQDISVQLQPSNIKIENSINEQVYSVEDYSFKTDEDVKDSLAKTFLNEVVKHVSKITIQDKTFDLTEYSFLDRLSIVENLPANLLQECIDYIHEYKNELNQCLIVGDVAIELDSTFFSA